MLFEHRNSVCLSKSVIPKNISIINRIESLKVSSKLDKAEIKFFYLLPNVFSNKPNIFIFRVVLPFFSVLKLLIKCLGKSVGIYLV